MIEAEEIVTRLSVVGRAQYSRELAMAQESVAGMSTATAIAGSRALSAERGMGFFRQGLDGIYSFAKRAAVGIGILTVAIGIVGKNLVEMASNAFETRQKFDKVFAGMGEGPRNFIDETFAKFGIQKKELEDAAALFGIFGKSAKVPTDQIAGFSETLVQAGIDMSSFYNKDPQQVFNAIASGLAGNIRPLRAYGIFLSQSVVKARAEQMGITGTLTDAQKVMIRQKLIVEQLGDAHHDLARTFGSLQNQGRALRGRLQQLGVTIGQMMLPYAIALFHGLNDALGPAVARIATTVEKLGLFSTTTAVRFGWMKTAADFLAGGVESFVHGGAAGLLAWMDDALNTGNFLQVFFMDIGLIIHALGVILMGSAVPAFKMWAPAITLVNIPLTMLAGVLGFLADHLEFTTFLIEVAIGVWVVWKAITVAQWIAMAVLNMVMWASRVPWAIMTAASWAHAAALTAEEAATWGLAGATWAALAPILALIALFVVVAVGTYMVLDHFDTLSSGAVDAFGYVEDAVGSLASAVSTVFFGVVDSIKGIFNEVLGVVETGINFGIELLNQGITAVNHTPGVYIDHIDYVQIPRLHRGGTVTAPGLVNYLPQEELVALPGGATVAPLAGLADLVGSGGYRDRGTPPMIIKVVMPNGKVLAETMIDGNSDIEARR